MMFKEQVCFSLPLLGFGRCRWMQPLAMQALTTTPHQVACRVPHWAWSIIISTPGRFYQNRLLLTLGGAYIVSG